MNHTGKPLASANTDVYETLGARWYEAEDDPIALLRAEARHRNPWIADQLACTFGRPCAVLDVGCGGGFLSNYLATLGHRVTGLDEAENCLAVAADHDAVGTVAYDRGDATRLPYGNGSFDVVCAMDFLEHVEEPERIVAEVGRVLTPSGLFFFHTFNRNFLSYLVVIKGVEWFVKNTPPDLHVLRLFLKPEEVAAMCRRHGMEPVETHGSRPKIGVPFFKMLQSGIVPPDFEFTFSPSTRLGFTGVAKKAENKT